LAATWEPITRKHTFVAADVWQENKEASNNCLTVYSRTHARMHGRNTNWGGGSTIRPGLASRFVGHVCLFKAFSYSGYLSHNLRSPFFLVLLKPESLFAPNFLSPFLFGRQIQRHNNSWESQSASSGQQPHSTNDSFIAFFQAWTFRWVLHALGFELALFCLSKQGPWLELWGSTLSVATRS
jgi:hypothetical protein